MKFKTKKTLLPDFKKLKTAPKVNKNIITVL